MNGRYVCFVDMHFNTLNGNANILEKKQTTQTRIHTYSSGTLAPPLDSVHRFDNNGHPIYLPPWMSDWLNLNVMVPTIAFIVIIVGILIICIALTRRRVDMRNGQKDVYCRCNSGFIHQIFHFFASTIYIKCLFNENKK